MFGIEDYNGPFQKLVVHVAGKPDIKTVHAPHSKPGSVLCSLHAGEKFKLFVQDTFEPVTFGVVLASMGVLDLPARDARGAKLDACASSVRYRRAW